MEPHTVAELLVQNAANILTALAAVLAALGALVSVVRNGAKVKAIDERTIAINTKADLAAHGATVAATKAHELHETTQLIAAQTDGQLTALLEENKVMREMFTKIVAILSARTGTVPAIRATDVDGLIEGVAAPPDTGERRRQQDRRKS